MDHRPARAQETPSTTADRRARRDAGNTFTEILVAIVLMGFAVTSVIAGIRMTILVSSTSDEQAKVEAVLTSASDRLSSADYVPCPSLTDGDYAHLVAAAADTVDWQPEQVVIEEILFWDASAGGNVTPEGDPIDADGEWSATNSFIDGSGLCNQDINLTTSRTLQRVTISVTSPDGSTSRSIEVVKSPIVADPGTNP
jgi:type II secretory pathway pseudopilin PulG